MTVTMFAYEDGRWVSLLFRTTYGPEVPALHGFASDYGAVDIGDLQRWFVQDEIKTTEDANLQEAVSFLISAGLLKPDSERPAVLQPVPTTDFRLCLLARLQAVYRQPEQSNHPLDPWFMGILDHCFVLPDNTHIPHLHRQVNSLALPAPCSEEKVNAWRRTMAFLGCGYRVQSGFLACYDADLVWSILGQWDKEGPLEAWLRHAESFLPVFTKTGNLATAMAEPLLYLERSNVIQLASRADFAGRAYLDERRIKWLRVEG